MVTIKKISREYETRRNEFTDFSWIHYFDTEEEFIKSIENLCDIIGEENIISVQFLNGDKNIIHCCIITHK